MKLNGRLSKYAFIILKKKRNVASNCHKNGCKQKLIKFVIFMIKVCGPLFKGTLDGTK